MRYLGGIQVYTTSTQTVSTGATGATLTYDTVAWDDLNVWPTGNQSTQIIVPANCNHIRLFYRAFWANQTTGGAITSQARLRPFLNGAALTNVLGIGAEVVVGTNNGAPHSIQVGMSTQIMPATPGDIWTVLAQQWTGQDLGCGAPSFGIEFYGPGGGFNVGGGVG